MEPLDRLISIDRSSPVPLYFQVARRLQELIESGELGTGARLDNEIALADQLGLSRPTVRQAMQHLVDKGLLARKRGVGTQVVNNRVRRQVELTSLYDDLDRAGRRPRTDVLSCRVVAASSEVAGALAVDIGADVLAVRRLRYSGDEPLAIMHNHLRVDSGVTAEGLAERGLYRLLDAAGIRIRLADQSIGARRATAAEARLLQEPRGATLLTLQRTAYDDESRPVEFGQHLYRAARYSFEMTVMSR